MIDDFEADEDFAIVVEYAWMNSPAKDYTVKIYSPYELTITDE